MAGARTMGFVLVASAAAMAPLAANTAGDRALGQYLSSECVTCHQLSGRQQQGIPSIVGLPETRIVDLLNEYRSKKRSNQVMQTVAGKLSADEIAALAAYFGSLRPRN